MTTVFSRPRRVVRGIGVFLFSMLMVVGSQAPVVFADDHASTVTNDVSQPGDYLTPEEVQEPLTVTDPSGRVTFTMSVKYDGTGHGTNEASPITEANGFPIGDEGPLDGVVSLTDTIGYNLSYTVKPSPTETKILLVPQSFLENEAGDILVANDDPSQIQPPRVGQALDRSNSTSSLANRGSNFPVLCEGGQGYGHTGKLTFVKGPLGPYIWGCEMTFPASEKSQTTNSPTIVVREFTQETDAFVGMGLAALTVDQKRSRDDEQALLAQKTQWIPHRTRIVGQDMADLTFRHDEPKQVFINGKGFSETTVEVFMIRNTANWVQRKGTLMSSRTGNGYPTPIIDGGINPGLYVYDTTGSLIFDGLPEGSTIISENDTMAVEGMRVNFHIPDLTSTPFLVNGSPSQLFNYGVFPDRISRHAVKVRVPLDALTRDLDTTIHLADVSMSRKIRADRETNLPLSPVMDDGYVFGSHTEEPGNNQPGDFDTKTLGTIQGQYGFANNDWASLQLSAQTGNGSYFKDVVRDESENHDLSDLVSVKMFSPDFTSPRMKTDPLAVYTNQQWWTVMGTRPLNTTFTNQMFCDAWNPRQQRIDTSRKVQAYASKGQGPQVRLDTDEYVVEYASSGTYPDVIGPVLGTGGTIPQDTRNTQAEACFTDPSIRWKTTPDATTDLVRVRFLGSTDGRVSVEASNRRFSDAAQVVYVPFRAADHNSEGFPTDKVAVDDRVVVRNNGRDLDLQLRARIWVNTLRAFIAPSLTSYSQNAGTTLTGRIDTGVAAVLEAPLGTRLPYDGDGSYTVRLHLPSAYSDISVNLPDNVELLEARDPDFGPDGMPGTKDDWGPDGKVGTADDAKGWVYTLKIHKDALKIMPKYFIVERFGNWFTGTLPGYIPDGTKFAQYTEVISEDLGLKDKVQDVILYPGQQSFLTVNAASSISQTKYALTPRTLIGNDISWDVVYANTFEQREFGGGEFLDVLPFNGDDRGTILHAPLSNVRFTAKEGDDDMRIEVTDADPRTVTREAVDAGRIHFVPLSQQDELSGEVTAYRIMEDTLDPKTIRRIRVTASSAGAHEGDVVFNNLAEAKGDNFVNPVPETIPVRTDLLDTLIDGTLWLDEDKDGVIDPDEKGRFPGARVSLIDGNGRVVASTTSDAQGHYAFATRPFSPDWTVRVSDRGANLPARFDTSTKEVQDAPLTTTQPRALDRNFGFYETAHPGITVIKTVRDHAAGTSLENTTTVTWEFTVKNTGNTTIENIVVNDNVLGTIGCPDDTLAPGKTIVCTKEAAIGVTEQTPSSSTTRR